jgi:hypothetical protein
MATDFDFTKDFTISPAKNTGFEFFDKSIQSIFPSYNPSSSGFNSENLFPAGSPLGTSYTPSMFGSTYADYDFTKAGNFSTPRSSFGAGSPFAPNPAAMGSRPGGSRQGTTSGGMLQATPIEFSLGPAPTLKELNLNYEEMGKRAMEANTPFRQQYQQMAPGTEAGARALSQAGATMATGQLSRDMAGQIGRGAASLGFSTGLGGRSGIGRNILARDLGLGVLGVQQQGADLLARSSALAQQAMQAMSPIAPGQVFDQAVSQASINQQIGNQNLINAYQSQNIPGTFDVSKGQFAGYQPGTFSTTRPVSPDIIAAAEAAKKAGGGRYSPYYQGYRV